MTNATKPAGTDYPNALITKQSSAFAFLPTDEIDTYPPLWVNLHHIVKLSSHPEKPGYYVQLSTGESLLLSDAQAEALIQEITAFGSVIH